ncbi:hypothetical protein [Winogradskyella sp. 3972H.M.0a.05]|uniref:hypothetical protein n=1 Tax=Winogradskyella sp. 3972H.M.0a.05 TaxID=2950277 RepID=UPI0033999373
MKNFHSTLVIFLLLCFLVSCDNDDSPSNTNNGGNNQNTEAFSQNFGNEISRSFLGTVIDKNKNPIEGVTISIGNDIEITDINGVFIINNATINERFAYIRAEKDGYIHGSRAVVPSEGTNKVTIMLLEETVVGTTSSGTSETISMGNGASVALEGDYTKDDGTSYEGNVDVIMHFLDPIDEDMQSQMPGMLYAANSNNEERMLQTFGMLAIELRGAGGEDLNLADGSEAEITVPLDPSLVANAPSTIPLWSFDEVNGYWKEEGQANLVDNSYVGTVTHFSFWNCDIPAEAVNLCITVQDVNDNLVNNLKAIITSTNYGSTSGYSNASGEVCGLVPANETLDLSLFTTICDTTEVFSGSIGPFSSDSEILVNSLQLDDLITEAVVGSFNDCDGQSIENGYVVLTYDEQDFYQEVDDGNFEINIIRCVDDNTFSINAYDFDNLQTSGDINFTFTTPDTNLGNLQSCNDLTEFIQYTIDGDTFIRTMNITASFNENSPINGGPWIQILPESDNGSFSLNGALNSYPFIGTYPVADINDDNAIGFSMTITVPISESTSQMYSLPLEGTFNVNHIGSVGEYIDISFTATYDSGIPGSPAIASGLIHVIRDQ